MRPLGSQRVSRGLKLQDGSFHRGAVRIHPEILKGRRAVKPDPLLVFTQIEIPT